MESPIGTRYPHNFVTLIKIREGIEVGRLLATYYYQFKTTNNLGRSLLHLAMEGKRSEGETGWRGKGASEGEIRRLGIEGEGREERDKEAGDGGKR
jgi:hypothetical protein